MLSIKYPNKSMQIKYVTLAMIQAEVLERDGGIKREYNELDTVWFMAGSLFKVIIISTGVQNINM